MFPVLKSRYRLFEMRRVTWLVLLLLLVVLACCVIPISARLLQTREEEGATNGIQEEVQGNRTRTGMLDNWDNGDMQGNVPNIAVQEESANGEQDSGYKIGKRAHKALKGVSEYKEVVENNTIGLKPGSNIDVPEKSANEEQGNRDDMVEKSPIGMKGGSVSLVVNTNTDIGNMQGKRTHKAMKYDNEDVNVIENKDRQIKQSKKAKKDYIAKDNENLDQTHTYEEGDLLQNEIREGSDNVYEEGELLKNVIREASDNVSEKGDLLKNVIREANDNVSEEGELLKNVIREANDNVSEEGELLKNVIREASDNVYEKGELLKNVIREASDNVYEEGELLKNVIRESSDHVYEDQLEVYEDDQRGKTDPNSVDGYLSQEQKRGERGQLGDNSVRYNSATGYELRDRSGDLHEAREHGFQEKGETGKSRDEVSQVKGPHEDPAHTDVYVLGARRDCKKSRGVLECGKYMALDYLLRMATDITESIHIWGPISVIGTPPSARSAEDTTLAELEPRTSDSSLQKLYKFAHRLLDRYTSTHALSWSLDKWDQHGNSVGRAKRGKGIQGKRTAQIVLPIIALVLVKLKFAVLMVLMVLVCMKQFMMFASIMMPLMSKVNLFGPKTAGDGVAVQPNAQPDPGQYAAGFQGYPYSMRPQPQPQPQYRTIIHGNDYLGGGGGAGGGGGHEGGGGSSYDHAHRAALRPRP